MNGYALVTGSSSGLGLEICNYLLSEDYFVFGVSRCGSRIDHQNYYDFEVDIKNEDQVSTLYEEISSKCDGLELVVNCAGIFELCALEDMDSNTFRNHLETNILGPFHIFKFCIDLIIEDETHFIQISSIASVKGYANCAAYSASKYGLNGMIDSLEQEWKRFGVKFSTLLPGAIDTPLWDDIDGFERDKMLSINDFMYTFDMIARAPRNLSFNKVFFMHKHGFLE